MTESDAQIAEALQREEDEKITEEKEDNEDEDEQDEDEEEENDDEDEEEWEEWYRLGPEKGHEARIERALCQRIFLISMTQITERKREFEILGNSGNLYKVTLGNQKHHCSCPDDTVPCKHILFVQLRIFKLAHNSPLVCKNKWDKKETESLFKKFPISQQVSKNLCASEEVTEKVKEYNYNLTKKRKAENKTKTKPESQDDLPKLPLMEICEETKVQRRRYDGEDCSICYEEMKPDKEEFVWCRDWCGQSFHKVCATKWASRKKTCPLCRKEWECTLSKPKSKRRKIPAGTRFQRGYLNLSGVQ